MNAGAQNRHMLFAIVLVITLLAMTILLYPALASSYSNDGSTITGNEINIGTVDEAACQQLHANVNSSDNSGSGAFRNSGIQERPTARFCVLIYCVHATKR